jgi:hypothetical protein
MRTALVLTTIALISFAVLGCRSTTPSSEADVQREIWQHLCSAERVEIFALDPIKPHYRKNQTPPPSSPKFHGWGILSKAVVVNRDDIIAMATALEQADRENDSLTAGCFMPRHGISWENSWAVVCFQCLHYHASNGGGRIASSGRTDLDPIFIKYDVHPLPDYNPAAAH